MLANLLLVVFLLLMTFIWGHYGLFSALLHLLVTVTAGTLALALWEPLTHGFLMGWFPEYAWGTGLLAPFLLLLFTLRLATDKLVPANMEFAIVVNLLGGGLCGLLAGILTAGLVLIALGFLPLDAEMAGYRPLNVRLDGVVERNQSLWPPVDRMAASFFAGLSGGCFSSRQPLWLYAPHLAEQADLYRLRADENATVAARPEMVRLGRYMLQTLPVAEVDPKITEALTPPTAAPTRRLVLVETVVSVAQGMIVPPYDADRRLRIPPAQVRLVALPESSAGADVAATLHEPVALVFVNERGRRQFVPVNNRDVSADSSSQNQTLAWAFLVPEEQTPRFLLFRHLRLRLPPPADAEKDAREVKIALGDLQVPEAAEEEKKTENDLPVIVPGKGVKPGVEADEITVTADLPRFISIRKSTGLRIDRNLVFSGHDTVRPPTTGVRRQDQIPALYIPTDQAAVRLKFSRDQLHSLYGRAMALAAEVGGAYLIDNLNNRHQPIAYVLLRPDGEQEINYPEIEPIKSAKQLPIDQMGEADALFLYFAVPSELSIVACEMGSRSWNLEPHLQLKPPE